MTPVKVLYVAGMPHSGTTILTQILGQPDGFVSVGELYYLWDGLRRGFPCGCGKRLQDCEWWSTVIAKALPGGNVDDLRPERYWMSLQQLPHVVLETKAAPSRAYREALLAVLRAARDQAGARVVVDSSKSPTVGRVLDGIEGIDLHVLHLVRTPQAVANSWSRFEGEAGRPVRHASVWSAWNALVDGLWSRRRDRYFRVRYEDFAERPRETVEAIARFVGEPGVPLPFVSDRVVRLEVTHTVAGNEVRFQSGEIEVRPDERWLEAYPERDGRILGALTWPLRARYGYR